jgi:flagellar export protein FliJ
MSRPFRFRLETVLRVRELREREAKRKFATKQAEIARLDRLNEETSAEILSHQGTLLAGQRNARLDPPALGRERAWIAHLRRTIVERQLARGGLVAQLASLRIEFQQARTARRTIEKLRERRFSEHRREQNLREQAEADELARQLPAANPAWLVEP